MFRRKKKLVEEDVWWYDLDEDNHHNGLASRRWLRGWGIGPGVTLLLLVVICFAFWSLLPWNGKQVPPTPHLLAYSPEALAPSTVSPPLFLPTSLSVTGIDQVGLTQTTDQSESSLPYDPVALARQMLILLNQERAAHGLQSVQWDATAALVGYQHTVDMVESGYFSHWNRDGLGPDHRYTLNGGQHVVMENLHALIYTYDDGRGALIENWVEVIQNAHIGLMNSPGHRANILDPAHTHVGIGMAYNPETGQFRLAQEFTNQYVHLTQPLPLQVGAGAAIVVQGVFNDAGLSQPLLNLAYEPFPTPMSIEMLNQTGSYSSAAAAVKTWSIDLSFAETIFISETDPPGFYHIRLFVDIAGQQAQVLNHVVVVR